MNLMCQGEASMDAIGHAHGVVFRDYFASELAELDQTFVPEGIVEMETDRLLITPKGRFFLRGIAMVFDRYFQSQVHPGRFSKLI